MVISGLHQQAYLNGQTGHLLGKKDNGRWVVAVDDSLTTIATQPANLKLLVNDTDYSCAWNSKETGEHVMFTMSYMRILQEIAAGGVGTTKEEVMENLNEGIYVGLRSDHFTHGRGPPLCIFVGKKE